jgi:hypothetical protein
MNAGRRKKDRNDFGDSVSSSFQGVESSYRTDASQMNFLSSYRSPADVH